MPIFSYKCTNESCGRIWDELRSNSERDERAECSHCEFPGDRRVTAPGGYNGDTGSASTRPKKAASRGSGEQLQFDFMKDKE